MNSLYDNQNKFDIRSLKQINTSMKLLNGLAKKNNFFFPCIQDGREILVNLKVVESGSEKGSFQISFSGEKYGKISIEGKINKDSLNVNILIPPATSSLNRASLSSLIRPFYNKKQYISSIYFLLYEFVLVLYWFYTNFLPRYLIS